MKLFREIYLHRHFFVLLLCCVFALVLAFVFPVLYAGVMWFVCMAGAVTILDGLLLFRNGSAVQAVREVAAKWSNGEDNPVTVCVVSSYPFRIHVRILDEIPVRFQRRDLEMRFSLLPYGRREEAYTLRPVKRGVYEFGKIRIFVTSRLSLVERRYSLGTFQEVAVYPSFVQMRKYELMAFTNRQSGNGVKRIRAAGVSTAFEQIKPYVVGDDPRTVNWKATAKCNRLMVNSYTDERSQQVYCVIDKGRTMQSPFKGMSMLDYAINAGLALTNVILKKGDKAGLLTFSNVSGALVKADNRSTQLNKICEALYGQRTHFLESDFEQLCVIADRQIHTRSLLVLFTNFDTLSGMRRHLPALRRLSKSHLLLVVLFEDTALRDVAAESADTIRDVYFKTIAGSFVVEKRKIAQELRHCGIQVVLAPPENLTVNTINSYLELKERGLI